MSKTSLSLSLKLSLSARICDIAYPIHTVGFDGHLHGHSSPAGARLNPNVARLATVPIADHDEVITHSAAAASQEVAASSLHYQRLCGLLTDAAIKVPKCAGKKA